MTPQELKASILQLAIQGKLVPQIPEEGTGEELLQQIQSEKQALIKSGKIKKEKNPESLGEIEAPFDIPDSWCWCRIEDCGCFIAGYTPKPNELDSIGTIPYFKVSDMNTAGNAYYLIHTSSYLRSNDAKRFWKNTIVYPKNGGAVFTNKKRILHQDSVVDLNTGGYYPYAPLDVHYIYIYFSNIDFRKCYKGTALPTIDMDKMRSKMIPVPPLAEQKRIVTKLEEILPLIDRYEAAWNKLEEFNRRFPVDMQKSILQMAIQGKLIPQRPEEGTGEELFQQIQAEKQTLIKAGKIKKEKPLSEITDDEIPFDIPDTWKWVRLGSLIHIESGKGLTAAQMKPGSIPVYGGNGITGYHNESLLHEETVVIGRVGFYCGSVHITEKECWVTDNAFITTYPQGCIDRAFLVHMLRHMDLGQNNNATAQPVVSGKKIYPMLFPLPPLAEQKRIVAKLEEILPLCDRLK